MGIRLFCFIIMFVVWFVGTTLAVSADETSSGTTAKAVQRTPTKRLTAQSLDGQPVLFADLLGSDGKA
ncbi:MAG: hypothetical protein EBU59_13315, partial [Planctomycetia bacterium]|nr:hypothetical protein [Planctomycetia bacterium]